MNEKIIVGGQILPISCVGDKLEWKNDQKNDRKKKISDVIKRIIPSFSPTTTFKVWLPWKVLSRTISRHHRYEIKKIVNKLDINNITFELKNKEIKPMSNDIANNDEKIGHGLVLTMWNGWKVFDISLLQKYITLIGLKKHKIE